MEGVGCGVFGYRATRLVWFVGRPSKSFDDIDFANASGRAPPDLKKRFAANWYCPPTSNEVGQRTLLDKFPVRDDRRRITSRTTSDATSKATRHAWAAGIVD